MKQTILFFFMLAIVACNKEGDTSGEELITTVIVTATPQGGGAALEFTSEDTDGFGGSNPPTTDNISLAANTTYNVVITLLNKKANPDKDVTEEVEEENTAHRFYYVLTPGVNVTISNLNNDDNGNPLGTSSTWTTTAASTGKVTITLRHYPGNPPNKQPPDPVNSSKSSTDTAIEFPLLVN